MDSHQESQNDSNEYYKHNMGYIFALVGDVYCIFVTFPCGILSQVWYLVVLFPDLCRLSYFVACVHQGADQPVHSCSLISAFGINPL